MELTMVVLAIFFGLVALGGASQTWGADSREPYGDDHAR
jgi:hypothetical protein